MGVALPSDATEPSEEVLAQLHPDELARTRTMRRFRLASFVGGRLAAHAAVRTLGGPFTGIGQSASGAPTPPQGVAVSISHKSHLAVAMAARSELGSLGIDLEDLEPQRPGIASKVLRPEEVAAIEVLSEERRWTATVLRFSLKEAIYKALEPKLGRYIHFDEASVALRTDGTADVTLHLASGPAPVSIDARYTWLDRSVLCSVRARW